MRALDLETYARERLGAGNWPRTDGSTGVVPDEWWQQCADDESEPFSEVCLGVDVALDRKSVAIAVCGLREDALPHLELVEVWPRVAGAAEHRQARRDDEAAAVRRRPGRPPVGGSAAGARSAARQGDGGERERIRGRRADVLRPGACAQSPIPTDRSHAAARRGNPNRHPETARRRLHVVTASSSASIAPLVASSLAVWQAVEDGPGYSGPLLELI